MLFRSLTLEELQRRNGNTYTGHSYDSTTHKGDVFCAIFQGNLITSFTTLVADAGGKHYYGSGTITIPANSTVPFATGTAILVIASGATTISPAGGVTLYQAGTGSTGSRTLAAYGQASLVKVGTDTWYISGVGIS